MSGEDFTLMFCTIPLPTFNLFSHFTIRTRVDANDNLPRSIPHQVKPPILFQLKINFNIQTIVRKLHSIEFLNSISQQRGYFV